MPIQSDSLVSFGSNIRSIDPATPGKVGAYGLIFGDPTKKDLYGTYFTPETNFGPTGGDGVQVLLNHGHPLSKELRNLADMIISKATVTMDEIGLFVSTVLDQADEYQAAIYALIQKGALRWSSATAEQLLRQNENGQITNWPICEWSLTPSPGEARLPAIAPLRTLKLTMPDTVIETETKPEAIRAAELSRIREIHDTVEIVKKRDKRDFSGLAAEAIKNGDSYDKFCRAITTSEKYSPTTEVHIGQPDASYHTQGDGSLGSQLVAHRNYRQAISTGGETKFKLELALPTGRRSFSSSGLTSIDKRPEVTLVPQQRLTIADLIPTMPTTGSTIRYMRETSYTNAATVVAEGATKPEASLALEEVDAAVRKIAVWLKASEEVLADYTQMQAFINNRLIFSVGLTEETEILNGDGTGQHLFGIFNTSGLQTQAVGADTKMDAIRKARTKLEIAHYNPTAIIVHPTDWQTLELLKDGNEQYFGGGPFTGAYGNQVRVNDTLWRLPVVVTTAMAQGTALMGDFGVGAEIHRRIGLVVEASNSDGDNFTKNMVTIRAETRLALTVPLPAAFCQITGL